MSPTTRVSVRVRAQPEKIWIFYIPDQGVTSTGVDLYSATDT